MKQFIPSWDSIDARPVPQWFDRAKFGLFVHWGLYSVPAYAPKRREVERTGLAYAEWYGWQIHEHYAPYFDFHRRVYGENFRYEDFAGMWKAELFDPDKWMDLFRRAGAKYLTLVTKHHDAFCLWPSRYSTYWNSVDIGPHRDIVGELYAAADRCGIRRGAYYSLLEWTHPVMRRNDPENADISSYAREKMIPQLKELVETYRPQLLFTDGEWSYPSAQWHSLEFLTWLFNESSVRDEIVVNDRWGSDTRCLHGGYFGTEYGEVNSAAQSEEDALGRLVSRKWEENRSIGASFGFNRNEDVEDYLGESELVALLVRTVAGGGNLCLNVGPCADGTIAPIIEERLLQLGAWLEVNGEAVYESSPVRVEGLPAGAYATRRDGRVYLIFTSLPEGELQLTCKEFRAGAPAALLGSEAEVPHRSEEGKLCLTVPLRAAYDLSRAGLTVRIG